MRKNKDAKSTKQKLTGQLRNRIRVLENARQHYEQNPSLRQTLKIANIELVQNDIEALKKLLSTIT
jgi:hypothetical protein